MIHENVQISFRAVRPYAHSVIKDLSSLKLMLFILKWTWILIYQLVLNTLVYVFLLIITCFVNVNKLYIAETVVNETARKYSSLVQISFPQ